jgi:hypothetical protein
MKSTELLSVNNKQQYFFIVLLLVLFRFSSLLSQEVLISGEGTVLANNLLKTRAHYENEALMQARENALENEFGTSVISNYERHTTVEMQGRSVISNSDRRSNYLNTFPNGVWIRDKNKSFNDYKDENGNYWFTCKLSGYARKIESAKVKFEAYTLDGTDPVIDRSETFVNGESGYLYFRSPEDGYLIVFYDDMKTIQRCIPYNISNENHFRVDNNKEYIFFSKEKCDYLTDRKLVDEIEFYTEGPIDYNQFYILFSPSPFGGYFYNPPDKLENEYKTFKWMDHEAFHSWLQDNRAKNRDLQLQIIWVTIKK